MPVRPLPLSKGQLFNSAPTTGAALVKDTVYANPGTTAAYLSVALTPTAASAWTLEISADGSTGWTVIDGTPSSTGQSNMRGMVPVGYSYRVHSTGVVSSSDRHNVLQL